MNLGKIFEERIKKSVPDSVFFYRFRDGTANFNKNRVEGIRFQQTNMCDLMLYNFPVLFLLELKSTKGSSLPFGNLKKHQNDELTNAYVHSGICAGFLVEFSEKGTCYFAYADDVKMFYDKAERKSFPISWFEENGIEISYTQKRVHKTYDIEELLNKLIEKEKHNGNLQQKWN